MEFHMSLIYIVSATIKGQESEPMVKLVEAKNKVDAASIFESYLVSKFDSAKLIIERLTVNALPDLIQERLSINGDLKKASDALALLTAKFQNDKNVQDLLSIVADGFDSIIRPSYTVTELLKKMEVWKLNRHSNESLTIVTYKNGDQQLILTSSKDIILNVDFFGFDVISDDGEILPKACLPSLLSVHSSCAA
jgi:hypothetical protein